MVRSSSLVGLLAVGACVLGAPVVEAQGLPDHVRCHRIRDPARVRAEFGFDAPLHPELSDVGCTIIKARYFCTPAIPMDEDPPPAHPEVTGQPLSNDYVCYKVRCPRKSPSSQQVRDRHAERPQTIRYGAGLLCVPAASPTTTTTTVMLPTTTTLF